MEITYAGGNSFLINAGSMVALNPGTAPKGAVVLRSRRKDARGSIVSGPGEYEIGGVLIVTVPAGAPDSAGLVHAIDLDGINILFVDGRAAELDEKALTAIGSVDILIIDTLDSQAAQRIARDLEPRVVLPFGPHAAELCATLGVKDPTPIARFTWKAGTSPQAVLLKAPGGRARAA